MTVVICFFLLLLLGSVKFFSGLLIGSICFLFAAFNFRSHLLIMALWFWSCVVLFCTKLRALLHLLSFPFSNLMSVFLLYSWLIFYAYVFSQFWWSFTVFFWVVYYFLFHCNLEIVFFCLFALDFPVLLLLATAGGLLVCLSVVFWKPCGCGLALSLSFLFCHDVLILRCLAAC